MKSIKIFFTNLFPSIILNNDIIATIVYNLSNVIADFQDKINKQLNTDI